MEEFFSEDLQKVTIFRKMKYKILDFVYRSVFEIYYLWFIVVIFIIFFGKKVASIVSINIYHYSINYVLFVSFVALLFVIKCLLAPKYKTRSISYIIKQFEAKDLIYMIKIDKHMKDMFNILVAIEDNTFFDRNEKQHVLTMKYIKSKIAKYFHVFFLNLQTGFSNEQRKGYDSSYLSKVRSYIRGYSTIEMQLIRTMGIELGYKKITRRKIYEYLYSNMILNGYCDYLKTYATFDKDKFKYFILYKYIDNVGIKINSMVLGASEKHSTVLQLYKTDEYKQISNEKFFVWCLGLPRHETIDINQVSIYADIIDKFKLDKNKIKEIIRNFSKKYK